MVEEELTSMTIEYVQIVSQTSHATCDTQTDGFSSSSAPPNTQLPHCESSGQASTDQCPDVCRCELCGQEFTTVGYLKYHQRSHRKLSCHFPDCNKTFAWPSLLKYHLMTHEDCRPYVCSYPECGRRGFRTHQQLQVHVRIHTNERPFICQVEGCHKTFRTAGNLKNHFRIHTGEKPFECPDCDKSFTEHSSLRKHSVVHSGAKPHKCPLCSKTFSQCGSRNVHIKMHSVKDSFSDTQQALSGQYTETPEQP